jgi:hypothetical protein
MAKISKYSNLASANAQRLFLLLALLEISALNRISTQMMSMDRITMRWLLSLEVQLLQENINLRLQIRIKNL